jgi:hypothetical protein
MITPGYWQNANPAVPVETNQKIEEDPIKMK